MNTEKLLVHIKSSLKARCHTADNLLTRLEMCNFYRLTKNSDREYTLIFGSELPKQFVRVFLEEYFSAMGIKADVKDNLTKLNITVKPEPR